MIDQV
ncbi:hypothetical protein D043_0644A, partial [Vibrio parahaemolyticus EKP-021]